MDDDYYQIRIGLSESTLLRNLDLELEDSRFSFELQVAEVRHDLSVVNQCAINGR